MVLRLIAYRLKLGPFRTTAVVISIAAVIAEILILEGFLAGMYEQLRQAVLRRGGDLIATQAGVSNFMAVRSILPQLSRLDVEAVEGVRAAHPITGLPVIYDQDGRRTPIFLFVYDTAGGPADIIAGKPIASDRGIIIDRALSVRYGLAPGDIFEVSDFAFTVSGISAGSSAFFTPFGFITYDDLIDFYFDSEVAADIATFPLLSFLLIDVEPDAEPATVAAHIEATVDEADVHVPVDLARRDENLARTLIGPVLGLMLAVSYVIGALVVAMFMSAAVRGRLRELGVLKALGFGPRALAGAVLIEAILLTVLAIPIGILLAHGAAKAIDSVSPLYLVLVNEPLAITQTVIACLAFAALGALVPMRTISRVDPADIFRG